MSERGRSETLHPYRRWWLDDPAGSRVQMFEGEHGVCDLADPGAARRWYAAHFLSGARPVAELHPVEVFMRNLADVAFQRGLDAGRAATSGDRDA